MEMKTNNIETIGEEQKSENTKKNPIEDESFWSESQEGRDEKVESTLVLINSGLFLKLGREGMLELFSGLSKDEKNMKKVTDTITEYYDIHNGQEVEINNESVRMPNKKVKISNTGDPVVWDDNMGLVLRHYVENSDGGWDGNTRRSPLYTALSEIHKEKKRVQDEKRIKDNTEQYLV